MKKNYPVPENITGFIPGIRMLLSMEKPVVTRLWYHDPLLSRCKDEKDLLSRMKTFEVKKHGFWNGKFIYLKDLKEAPLLLQSFLTKYKEYSGKEALPLQIVVIQNYGVLAAASSSEIADKILGEFENFVLPEENTKGLSGSEPFKANLRGESEYTEISIRKDTISSLLSQSLVQKICIVTGGARGFGEGIARELVKENANVIIADANSEIALETSRELSEYCTDNHVMAICTDVSDAGSVRRMVYETVLKFGGIDILISNAGILRAGGLDEMDQETFAAVTKVNYEGYFLCVKYVSSVMKLQNQYKPDHFSDIIQINSKSGLKGSNRNFAYSGGKFGGIGLTQSFALELAPYRIKVNSICPGNFFEGPLWSDPVNGLFVQYLKAGKVPGASTIEDVKRYYERQVPLGRGCSVEDLMKAIYYVIMQNYETGQAIPVTGGQEMLK